MVVGTVGSDLGASCASSRTVWAEKAEPCAGRQCAGGALALHSRSQIPGALPASPPRRNENTGLHRAFERAGETVKCRRSGKDGCFWEQTPGPLMAGVGLGPTRAPISKGIMLQKEAECHSSGLTERSAWYSPPICSLIVRINSCRCWASAI